MLSLSRYPDVSVPAPMANITAVLRPEITRVKELAMLVRSQLLSGKVQMTKVTLRELLNCNLLALDSKIPIFSLAD